MISFRTVCAIGLAMSALVAPPARAENAPVILAQATAPGGEVLASAQYANDPDLRCDLLEVKRVSGGALVVRWRIINTAAPTGGMTGTKPKAINYDFSWEQLFYIDPAENKKYQYLTDSGGNKIVDVFYGNLDAGQQRLSWAKFPAPPASSTKISVSLPKFAPFEDVPVSQ